MITLYVRLYEELNRVLPEEEHKKTITRTLAQSSNLKDLLDILGLQQEDIDLALVNSHSVPFDRELRDGDLVSLYPEFETLNIQDVSVLREKPLRNTKFVAAGALRELANLLQARGYECLCPSRASGSELIRISRAEKRILLTLDPGLAKSPELERCYLLSSREAKQQLREVLQRFQLD